MEQPVPAVLAAQLRLIWLLEVAVAPSPLGAVGAAAQAACVVALAWFDEPEEPAESTASTK